MSLSRQHQHHAGGGGGAATHGTGVNMALVGAIGSGKSALTVKYITKRFINEYDPFLEDTYLKHEVLDNQEVSIRVMDTCDKGGVDPDRYLRWADAYLIVYSITDPESFETAASYLDAISNHMGTVTSYESPMILIGNKSDLERYRQVSAWEGRRLARRHESSFFETSAAEGSWESVANVFREAARQALVLRQDPERPHAPPPLYIEEAVAGDRQQRRLTPSSSSSSGEKGRKDSRGEGQPPTPSPPCGGLSPSSGGGGTRFSFLKGIVPLKGIFQSSGGNGGGGSPTSPSSTATPSPTAPGPPGGAHLQPTTMATT